MDYSPTAASTLLLCRQVERVFMAGLRAADPTMRRRFFDIYNANIPATLYDRLYFVIVAQDWETMVRGRLGMLLEPRSNAFCFGF